MNGEIFEGQVCGRLRYASMPHVGFSMSNLSKMEEAERECYVSAEKIYKTGISKGDDESLFLLMLLYSDADEKNSLLALWQWARDRDNDIEGFLDFAAEYLTLFCISVSPPKEIINLIMPYYEDIKRRILNSNEWPECPDYDKDAEIQLLDTVLLADSQVSPDCVH